MAIDNEEKSPSAAKAIENNFFMDDFIKSVDSPEEASKVFKQLQPRLSRHGIELKRWLTNWSNITEEIPEDLISLSNTKQVVVEPS